MFVLDLLAAMLGLLDTRASPPHLPSNMGRMAAVLKHVNAMLDDDDDAADDDADALRIMGEA